MSRPPAAGWVEVLDAEGGRLEAPDLPEPPPPPARRASLALAGAAILVAGLVVLGTAGMVVDQFARSLALGWATLAVAALGFGMLGLALLRELAAVRRLGSVDRLRARMADNAAVREAAREWLDAMAADPAALRAIGAQNDPDAIRAILRNGPVAERMEMAKALGQRAAFEVMAITAAAPSPALDALLVTWRGTRLVRQVAETFGLRPGALASLVLMRRTLTAAALVGAANMAVDTGLRALAAHPLMRHLAGDAAGSVVAARRMVVLARAAAAACSPLPPAD